MSRATRVAVNARALQLEKRKRRRIAVGMLALLLLLPVAIRLVGSGKGPERDTTPSGLGSSATQPLPGVTDGTSTNTARYDVGSHHLSFDLPAFGGGHVSSTSLAGHPAVVNFYASWCTVCHQELPAFEAVSKLAGSRAVFVGANPQFNDNDAQQARLVAETGVTYATVRDHDQALLNPFNSTGSLPVTLFLRADGTVADTHLGGLTQSSLTYLMATDLGVHV